MISQTAFDEETEGSMVALHTIVWTLRERLLGGSECRHTQHDKFVIIRLVMSKT